MHAKGIGRNAKRHHAVGKALPKRGIGDDDVSDMRAGDVEGLCRRGHHDQPVDDLRCRQRHRQMPLPGEDQIMVHLVRDQQKVMALAECGHAQQFFCGPDPPARIVRRTQDQQLFTPGHLAVPGGKIHLVASALRRKPAFDQGPVGGFDDPREGMIDRRHQHDAVAGDGVGLQTDAKSVNQPVGGKDRPRVHVPAVAGLHPPPDCVQIGGVIAEIAIYAMPRHLLDRLLHTGRRVEFHIGNPHRKAGIGRNAVNPYHHVPFDGMAAPAVDRLVEVHLTCPERLCPCGATGCAPPVLSA